MADDEAVEPIHINSSLRVFFACVGLVFFSTIIVLLLIKGDSNNSLHTSALGWCFAGDLGLLAALVTGTVTGALQFMRK